jgi:hypothetical protein
MPERDSQNESRRGPLLALAAIVFIFMIGWILVHEMYSSGQLEDCLLSGRTNCAPIQTPAR